MLTSHDVSPLKREMWTAETVGRFPDKTTRGPEEPGDYLEGQFATLTDGRRTWSHSPVRVTTCSYTWHLTGTHSGPMFGVEPTDSRAPVDGIDHFVLRGGKVVSVFVAMSGKAFARQSEMMPPDGSRADML